MDHVLSDASFSSLMVLQVYIVYLGALPTGRFSPMAQHYSLLDDVLEGRYVVSETFELSSFYMNP